MPPRSPCPNCGWKVTDKYAVASALLVPLAPVAFCSCGAPAWIGVLLGLVSIIRLKRQHHLKGFRWAFIGVLGNAVTLLFFYGFLNVLFDGFRKAPPPGFEAPTRTSPASDPKADRRDLEAAWRRQTAAARAAEAKKKAAMERTERAEMERIQAEAKRGAAEAIKHENEQRAPR